MLRQLSIDEADALLKKHRAELPGPLASKLEQGVRAAHGGVERIHIIDGRVEEGLLAEVFSNEGVGTLIHANEYQAIRKAHRRDARAILALTRNGVANDELVRRTRAEIERQIDDFFVFEVDRNPVGCAALHLYPQWNKAELAAVCVDARYENQGIGAKLMQYGEAQARAWGRRNCSACPRRRSTIFSRRAASSPARRTTCRRRAANAMTRAAGGRWCWSRNWRERAATAVFVVTYAAMRR